MATRTKIIDTLRGASLDEVSLTVPDGASTPFPSDGVDLQGNAVSGIYCPSSLGAITALTGQVSRDGTTWYDLATWSGITPVADDAFQLGATDIWGWRFFRLLADQDPTADVTFILNIKAI